MNRQGTLSSILLLFSALCSALIIGWFPWHLNPNEFLVRPILIGVLPLFASSLTVWRSSAARRPPIIVSIIVLSCGVLEFLILLGFTRWPTPNLPTAWEDTFEQLFELEALLMLLTPPLWGGCLVSVFWGLSLTRSKVT